MTRSPEMVQSIIDYIIKQFNFEILGIKKPWANQEPYNPSIDVEEPLAKHKQP
jgi:hypothetical protein